MDQRANDGNPRVGKRNRVLDEAAKTLNRLGISHTSLPQIAKNAGVSRAALYYYFEDQRDLVFQCYSRSCEHMARSLNEASHFASSALKVIDAFLEGTLAEGKPELAALSDAAFLRPEQRSTILGLYEGLRANLAEIIQQGIRRQELRSCQARLVSSAIIGLISWFPAARRWRSAEPLSARDLIDAVKSVLHYGVAVNRTQPVRYNLFELSSIELPVGQVFDPVARANARQEALLAAASWLFNLKGVHATSLEEIAQRVGVTKKVIYHNMLDKGTLVAQCVRRAFRFYQDIGRRVSSYEGAGIDALCAALHALAEASLREDIAPLAAIAGDEDWREADREELQAWTVRLMDIYLEGYSRGQAEGSVREVNARAVAAMIPGIYEWLPKWFDALEEPERTGAPRELAELFRLGLARL